MTKVNFRKLTFYTCFVKEGHLHRCVFQCIFVPPRCESNKNVRCNMWGTPRVVPQSYRCASKGFMTNRKWCSFTIAQKPAILYVLLLYTYHTLEAFGNSLVFVILKDFWRWRDFTIFHLQEVSWQTGSQFAWPFASNVAGTGSAAHCSASPGAEAGLPVKVAEKTPQGYRIVILEDFSLMLQQCVMI